MLYNFKKYRSDFKNFVDIKHRNNNLVVVTRYCINIKISPFFRKMFFRTLLLYLNSLNCNFFYSAEQNYFYFVTFIYSKYYMDHASFYYRHAYVM